MVPQPPSQPRGTRHYGGLDSHHDRPHRHRRGEGRALAPDHLHFRGLRPLPEADPPADSGGHPRTPWVATYRQGAPRSIGPGLEPPMVSLVLEPHGVTWTSLRVLLPRQSLDLRSSRRCSAPRRCLCPYTRSKWTRRRGRRELRRRFPCCSRVPRPTRGRPCALSFALAQPSSALSPFLASIFLS